VMLSRSLSWYVFGSLVAISMATVLLLISQSMGLDEGYQVHVFWIPFTHTVPMALPLCSHANKWYSTHIHCSVDINFNLLFLTVGIQFEQGVQGRSSSSVERS